MATVWPSPVRTRASDEPTRPQPTMTTCTEAECKSGTVGRGRDAARRRSGARRGVSSPLRMVSLAKRILIGRPIATSEEGHQRLRKRVALPIFASDAISSTAYATDEIILVLALQAGIGARRLRQARADRHRRRGPARRSSCCRTARRSTPTRPAAAPTSCPARTSARCPSLVAGASLLTDYILTVAVSVAGGVLAIQSAFGFDSQWRVPLCLLMIVVMTVANLRGLRESGSLFAPPTYLYIVMLVLLIVVGCYRIFVQDLGPIPLESLSEEAQRARRGHRGAQPADAAAGVLVRRRRAVRRRGGVQRRAGVPQAGGPQRLDDAGDHGGDPRRLLHRRVGPRLAPPPAPRRGGPDRHRPDGRAHLRRQERSCSGSPSWPRSPSSSSPPTPPTRASPGCRRSSPATATCPASSPTAATSWCSPTGSSSSPSPPAILDHRLQGQHLGPHPAVRVRRVHRLHAEPGRHGRATTSRTGSRAGGRRWRSTPSAAWPRRPSRSSSSSPSSPRGRGSRPC